MKKIGILGGGQLGRMLLQAAANYPVETYVLENDANCPSAHLCHHFTKGNIQDFDTVYAFGKALDVLTIEIEAVNVEAIEKLEQEGVQVIPSSASLRIIKNKITQKNFYKQHQIPTAPYIVTENKAALLQQLSFLPAVHKLAQGGYDGKGVEILKNENDLTRGFDAPSVLEKMIHISKEISMLVAVAQNGEIALYPPAEMVFDPKLNLLDYQIAPAKIEESVLFKAEAIAISVVKNLASPGLFAVELLVDQQGEVYVNETAPRVHNSGHHSIEGNYSSQFDMLWRILLDYPLGSTEAINTTVLLNIIGAEGHSGEAVYLGLEQVLKTENAFVHLYGKKETKPGRKMGHITLLGQDASELVFKANRIKSMLKVVAAACCIILLLSAFRSQAQCVEFNLTSNGDTLNCKDKKGIRHGKWVHKVEEIRGEPGYEEEGMYEKDQKTGFWRLFNLQGDLIGIENYRYGQKNGLQQYFSINGSLIKEESWLAHNPENPTEMVEVFDINDPNKIYMVEVKLEASAVPHGLWKYFDPQTGKMFRKDNYILGKLDDGSGTGNGMIKKNENDEVNKEVKDPKPETKEKPKEKPKPKEVMDFEKKNDGKKNIKIRTGATG